MNHLQRFSFHLLVVMAPALTCLLLLVTPVYADDCLRDPLNAKDCERTPGYKQFITTAAIALGVTEVALASALAPYWEKLILIDKTGKLAENAWNWLYQRFGKPAIQHQGANLASQTADILNALGQSPPSPPPAPSPPSPPVQPNWTGAPTTKIIDSYSDGDPTNRNHQAVKILKDFNVWDDLKSLNPAADDYWQRMDDILRRAQNKDSRVQAIAFEHPKDEFGNDLPGILNDNVTIVVEEPEYGPYFPPAQTPSPPPAPPDQPAELPEDTKPPSDQATKPDKEVPVPPPVTLPPPPVVPPKIPPAPPKPPPEMRSAPESTPSGTAKNTFQDATPEQEKLINTAHEIAQGFTDNAISTLEAAKNSPNPLVQQYFGVKGTTPEDIAKIDALRQKFEQLRKQLQNGLSYEVESDLLLTSRRNLPFGYVYTLPIYGGVGDIHIVAPAFKSTSVPYQGRVVLHEATHYTLNTDDHAYSWQAEFQSLTQKQQFDNADSLAAFAYDCQPRG